MRRHKVAQCWGTPDQFFLFFLLEITPRGGGPKDVSGLTLGNRRESRRPQTQSQYFVYIVDRVYLSTDSGIEKEEMWWLLARFSTSYFWALA